MAFHKTDRHEEREREYISEKKEREEIKRAKQVKTSRTSFSRYRGSKLCFGDRKKSN